MSKNEFLSFEELKEKLADKKLYVVAKKTGLSFPTLRKMALGTGKGYNMETMRKITEYLRPSNN